MSQRNLDEEDVEYVRSYGRRRHCAGAIFYFLPKRGIPDRDLADASLARLEGCVAVFNKEDEVLITVYRNRKGFKKIRSKVERDLAT